mmetsp:Transcript_94684/g.304768  ORF Transcript_94684/g.304768 Transcript_94684/m.304768 type:complete len:225 (+) Transcript_94684:75-749(+)
MPPTSKLRPTRARCSRPSMVAPDVWTTVPPRDPTRRQVATSLDLHLVLQHRLCRSLRRWGGRGGCLLLCVPRILVRLRCGEGPGHRGAPAPLQRSGIDKFACGPRLEVAIADPSDGGLSVKPDTPRRPVGAGLEAHGLDPGGPHRAEASAPDPLADGEVQRAQLLQNAGRAIWARQGPTSIRSATDATLLLLRPLSLALLLLSLPPRRLFLRDLILRSALILTS